MALPSSFLTAHRLTCLCTPERHGCSMAMRAVYDLAVAVILILAGPACATESLPPMAGKSDNAAKVRAALFATLAAAKNDAEARAVEDRLWTFWRSAADEESRRLLEISRQAQLNFGRALDARQKLVKHQPNFREGWNQLAYILFLANSYGASLKALDKTLELEPMHYAHSPAEASS